MAAETERLIRLATKDVKASLDRYGTSRMETLCRGVDWNASLTLRHPQIKVTET